MRAGARGDAFRTVRSVWLAATGAILLAATYASARGNNPGDPGFDKPLLTRPFEGAPFADLLDLVFGALARWDAVHYLAIANDGYVGGSHGAWEETRAGFFPLYPMLVRVLSGDAAHPAVVLILAQLVSVAAFLAALYLLYRLVELELGDVRVARAAIVLLAASPFALYFVAPYTESLFLAIVIGAFYAARTGHWAAAGILGALATACRVPGIAILAPLVVLYFYGPRADRPPVAAGAGLRALLPRYRPRLDGLWLALVPAGIASFSAYLHLARGDALAWLHNQAEGGVTGSHRFFPFQGVWEGFDWAWHAVTQLASTDPAVGARADDLLNFAALLLVAAALVWMVRRLPFAYVACTLAFVAIPLSATTVGEPLKSFARYATIAFPLFICLAAVCERRRATAWVAGASAVLLLVHTAAFARWQWVA